MEVIGSHRSLSFPTNRPCTANIQIGVKIGVLSVSDQYLFVTSVRPSPHLPPEQMRLAAYRRGDARFGLEAQAPVLQCAAQKNPVGPAGQALGAADCGQGARPPFVDGGEID